MANTQQKPNQKKQENINPSTDRSGKDFNRQNENTDRRSERDTTREKDTGTPGQNMRNNGFDYEQI